MLKKRVRLCRWISRVARTSAAPEQWTSAPERRETLTSHCWPWAVWSLLWLNEVLTCPTVSPNSHVSFRTLWVDAQRPPSLLPSLQPPSTWRWASLPGARMCCSLTALAFFSEADLICLVQYGERLLIVPLQERNRRRLLFPSWPWVFSYTAPYSVLFHLSWRQSCALKHINQ